MDANFWHRKWHENEIGFHQNEVNPLLIEYFSQLSLNKGSRIFIPLCGKTLDIAWLMNNGYRVVGAELSEKAVSQLFVELGVKPQILKVGKLELYTATNIEIFVGDIFNMTNNKLGLIDAIYDRAALVALPYAMRKNYTELLKKITNKTKLLLICLEYDQSIVDGPPFSISKEELNIHFAESYDLTLLKSTNIPGGLKGKYAAKENVWLLEIT